MLRSSKFAVALLSLLILGQVAAAQTVGPQPVPSGLPPDGAASGDLGGTYPGPTVTNGSHITNNSITPSGLASTVTAGGPTGSATAIPVITYNASGQITTVTTTPNAPPYFDGTLITAAQSVTSGQFTKILLNSVIDPSGWWSGTNFNWNPQLAGHYRVCAGTVGIGTTVTIVEPVASKSGLFGSGGTAITLGYNQGLVTAATQGAVASCRVVAMNGTTDTIELDDSITGTGTVQAANNTGTSLDIWWIGP